MYAHAVLNTHLGSAAGFPPPPKRRKCDIDSDEEHYEERLDMAIPEYTRAMTEAPGWTREDLPSALQARVHVLLARGAPQWITLAIALASAQHRLRCCAAWCAGRPLLAGCPEPACECLSDCM